MDGAIVYGIVLEPASSIDSFYVGLDPVDVEVTNDDNEANVLPGSLRFSQATYSAIESAGTVTVTVERVEGTSGTVTVQYSASDGTARAGSEYDAATASGTLTFGPGERTKSFRVRLLNDSVPESRETFTVALGNPTGGATLISPQSTDVTILDDDRRTAGACSGALDQSFDGDGKVITDLTAGADSIEQGNAILVQPDGKIVVGGRTGESQSGGGDFALVRYLPDGRLDASFGAGGIATAGSPGNVEGVYGLALQSDGKIIAAGVQFGSGYRIVLARFHNDGQLDTSFGGGIVVADFGDEGRSVAIDSDGRVVIAGVSNDQIRLARFNSNGAIDTNFATNGTLTADFGPGRAHANDVRVLSDGKIVIAGQAEGSKLGLMRFETNGTLDSSFGTGGKVSGPAGYGRALWLQSDGKLLVAGGVNGDFVLARYNSDGSPDTGFGQAGQVTTDFGSGSEEARSVSVLSDGRIVAAGVTNSGGGGNNFAVAVYASDGTLDMGFGTGGRITTDFLGGGDEGWELTVEPGGKIVVAGTVTGTGNMGQAVGVVRYECGTPISAATVSGTVFNDRNGNGARDPGEPGLQNATLRFITSDGTSASSTTGADGSYRFDNVPPGNYRLTQDVIPGYSATLPGDPAIFTSRSDYSIGEQPEGMAVGDVNGDGNPDVLTGHFAAGTVTVLLGRDDGSLARAATFTVGAAVHPIGLGDIDGDGDLDLVAGSARGNWVRVFCGNGDGTFGPMTEYVGSGGPNFIVLEDADGDGDRDLITPNVFGSTVSVWRNDGSGNFAAPTNYAVGQKPNKIAVADLNGDGNFDIATADDGSASVTVLLGNGDGTFAPGGSLAGGEWPRSIAAADIDGDRDIDLVVSNFRGSSVSVLLNNGDGTFGGRRDYPIGPSPSEIDGVLGTYPTFVTLADVDRDGTTDIVASVAADHVVSVLPGVGDGTFLSELTFQVGYRPQIVQAADFDRDGDVDLVTINGDHTASVLLSNAFRSYLLIVEEGAASDGNDFGNNDRTPPVFLAVPMSVSLEATTTAGTTYTYQSPTAVDLADPSPAVACDKASGSIFGFGTTTVTCSARDAAGNTRLTGFGVTVHDTMPPVMSNVSNDLVVEANVARGAIVQISLPTATDAVDPSPHVSCSPGSGAVFPIGNTLVTCTAVDDSLNTSWVSFRVTVRDTTAPVINSLPEQLIVEALSQAGAVVSYLLPTVSDIADENPSVACSPMPATAFPLGTTTVTCTTADASGNSRSAQFPVTVVDTTAPGFSNVPLDLIIEATSAAGAPANYAPPSAIDAVDANPIVTCSPPSGSVFALDSAQVVCTATDAAQNARSVLFNVTVRDSTPPTLILPAPITAEATGPTGARVSYTATAMDVVDGTVSVQCLTPFGATFSLGTTTVACTARDSAGNAANGSFAVTVQDTTAPELVLPELPPSEATSPSSRSERLL